MRLKRYLQEDGEGGGAPGAGGNTVAGSGTGPANTTTNIAKFWSKIGSSPIRRVKKKKKKEYEEELSDNIFLDFSEVLSHSHRLNEAVVPDSVFQNIRRVGEKIGFKINKSDTVWDYIARGEKEIVEIFDLVCLYILATDEGSKNELKIEIKQALLSVNRKRIVAFFVQLDKFTFGIVALVRRVIQNVFGVEITSYNQFQQDIDYILTHLGKVKKVLLKLDPTKEEMGAYNHLYDVIMKTKEEVEKSKAY